MPALEIGEMNPLVRFEHIEKSYDGETLVVRDLNLDIAQGEFLTMLGPSGSGKSTVGKLLSKQMNIPHNFLSKIT